MLIDVFSMAILHHTVEMYVGHSISYKAILNFSVYQQNLNIIPHFLSPPVSRCMGNLIKLLITFTDNPYLQEED